MRVMFSPELVNEPFGDPGLFVDFNFEHRALLFDLGELGALAPRKLLRVSDVFVSHTHMDHFVGFDHLLRLCLGRPTSIRLYGPPGFTAQVEHKLGAYTWNLVENYPGDFFVEVWEVAPDWQGLASGCAAASASAASRCRRSVSTTACCATSRHSACGPRSSATVLPASDSRSRRRCT
jgi:ribonuclease BN (tRNA processing enzyme)